MVPQEEAGDGEYIPVLKSSTEVEQGLDRDVQHAHAGLWSRARTRVPERKMTNVLPTR